MTNPYRSLCAELVAIEDALSGGSVQFSNQGQSLDGYSALATFRDVTARSRALLDQFEPPDLTDDKLMDIACATDLVYDRGKYYGFATPYMEETDITAEVLAFARTAIAADRARWGPPTNNTGGI
jgi:hypothetical protein